MNGRAAAVAEVAGEKLAVEGGRPASPEFVHLSRPWIGDEERAEVMDTLNGMWLSRGPKVSKFEEAFGAYVGVPHAIAVSSCTAALHVAVVAAGVKEGDEVITSTVTFPATANAVMYERAKPVLVDVDRGTMNMNPDALEAAITKRTKAIIPVHMLGQPCDMDRIMDVGRKHGIPVIEDAAHAVGARFGGKPIGSIGDFGAFSFYASKNLCTGDGGMLTVRSDEKVAEFARMISLHGMSATAWKRYTKEGSASWELLYPGFKYNMTDIEASLGIHQLRKIERITELRTKWATSYSEQLSDVPEVSVLDVAPNRRHAWHLFVIVLKLEQLSVNRSRFIELLKAENIGTGIHFTPVHQQRFYRDHFSLRDADFPNASWLSDRILSLPLFPQMTQGDVDVVVRAVKKVVAHTRR